MLSMYGSLERAGGFRFMGAHHGNSYDLEPFKILGQDVSRLTGQQLKVRRTTKLQGFWSCIELRNEKKFFRHSDQAPCTSFLCNATSLSRQLVPRFTNASRARKISPLMISFGTSTPTARWQTRKVSAKKREMTLQADHPTRHSNYEPSIRSSS